MERWYTSDLHFGHRKAIQFRPFDSVEEMDEALVALWNEVVAPDDEVWILGDLAMYPHDESLTMAARLHGHKILVPGNHDECWPGKQITRPTEALSRKSLNRLTAQQAMYKWLGGIAEVAYDPIPHTIAGHDVALSHFPYTADHTGEIRYPAWRPPNTGGWLLHGHLHEMWRQHDREINVGVDAWALRPVHVSVIEAMIHAGPQDLSPLATELQAA